MAKLKGFHIVLHNNNNDVYTPGEDLSGHVVVDLRDDMKMQGIRIFMRGLAKVHWRREGRASSAHSAEEEYFYLGQVLFGKADYEVGPNPTLRTGHHELQFFFQIPCGKLATSFEGKHGRIRYWLKAEIVRPWRFNCKTIRAFTLIDHLDINTESLLTPQSGYREKTVCCGFCVAGNISMSVRTDRMGYCPGESIAISAEFQNGSGRRLFPMATLYQNTTFSAKSRSVSVKKAVVTLEGRSIPGMRNKRWHNKLLKIPPITPTLASCGIIRLEYSLQISLQIIFGMDLNVYLPVVVGTVPRSTPADLPLPADPLSMNVEEYQPPVLDAPPSYAECVFGGVDIQYDEDDPETTGNMMFTPMYTYVSNYEFRELPPPYSPLDPDSPGTASSLL